MAYILDTVIKIDANDSDLLNSRIQVFCECINKAGFLNKTLNFVRDRYSKQFFEDTILNSIFTELLNYYFALPKEVAWEDIYSLFNSVQNLIGDDANTGLTQFIFKCYADRVVFPYYEQAIKDVRIETMRDIEKEKYEYFISILTKQEGMGFNCVIQEINDLLARYEDYKNQTRREQELLQSRINFVARELTLLENKTIYKILLKYVGEDRLAADSRNARIKDDDKMYNDPKFLNFAKDEALNYLNDRKSQGKLAFCEEISEERKRNFKDYRISALDMTSNLVGSLIFSAIMAIIVGFLGGLVYFFLTKQYFKNLYILFSVGTFFFSMGVYWSNYKGRKLRNIVVMSTWQMLFVIVATLGVFTITQFIMIFLSL